LNAFRQQIDATRFVRLRDIGKRIVNSPSPRFWVSEERAAAVVSAIMRGKPVLKTMRPTKREMFEEIHRRVVALKKEHPDWHLSRLVFEVVNSPAPKFYMEPSSALERLFKIRNQRVQSQARLGYAECGKDCALSEINNAWYDNSLKHGKGNC